MDFCEMDPARLNHFHRAIGSEPDMIHRIILVRGDYALARTESDRFYPSNLAISIHFPELSGRPLVASGRLGRTPHGAGGEG